MSDRARAMAVGLGLLSLLAAEPARADGPIGANGEPITTSSYSVDFTPGPVLSSSRATGLAGAYTAIAEGAEGGLSNPASVANRYPASVEFWDYWLAFGVTYPFENGDFFNSGSLLGDRDALPESSFLFFNPGLYVQLWNLGLGLDLEIQQAEIRGTPPGSTQENVLHLSLITNHVQIGWLFLDGQLAVGGGLTVLRQLVSGGPAGEPADTFLNTTGFGAEVGALLRPNGKQWRIGAGLYSTVRTRRKGADASGDVVVNSFYLPRSSVRPWRGSVAFAYQLLGRPLNPRFTYVREYARAPLAAIDRREEEARRKHEARLAEIRAEGGVDVEAHVDAEEHRFEELEDMFDAERDAVEKEAWRRLRARVRTGWPRRYVLLTAELTFNGSVEHAVGVESFLLQTVQRSGEHVTVTPRIAAESEVWPDRLKLRGGLYVEPARLAHTSPRVHGTLGADLKLFGWDVFHIWPEDYLWQLTAAVDVTRDYASFSFGIGGWY